MPMFNTVRAHNEVAPILSKDELLSMQLQISDDVILTVGEMSVSQVNTFSYKVDRQCDNLVDEYEDLMEGVSPERRGAEWEAEYRMLDANMEYHANLQRALELRDIELHPETQEPKR